MNAHAELTRDSQLTLTTSAHPAPPDAPTTIYLLHCWLPIVGPTCLAIRDVALMLLAERSRYADIGGTRIETRHDVGDLLDAVGVAHADAFAGNLWRGRRMGFWQHREHAPDDECTWHIPRAVPIVPDKVLAKAPAAVRDHHDRLVAHLVD